MGGGIVDGNRRVLLHCLLLDGVGIAYAADDLLILILKFLDALLELVELLGEVNALARTACANHFARLLSPALLRLHQLLSGKQASSAFIQISDSLNHASDLHFARGGLDIGDPI